MIKRILLDNPSLTESNDSSSNASVTMINIQQYKTYTYTCWKLVCTSICYKVYYIRNSSTL
jgi:hypothetical protein